MTVSTTSRPNLLEMAFPESRAGRVGQQSFRWDPLSLKFNDADLEDMFASCCHLHKSQTRVLGGLAMGFGGCKLLSAISFEFPVLSGGLGVACAWVCMCSAGHGWKILNVSSEVHKLLCMLPAVCCPLYAALGGMNVDGKELIVATLVLPVTVMFSMAMCCRLTFRNMIKCHTLAAIVSYSWTMAFCTICSETLETANFVRQMNATFHYVSTVVFRAFGFAAQEWKQPASYWPVVAFMHITCVWMLPLLFMYCREVSSRRDFLMSRMSQSFGLEVVQFSGNCRKRAFVNAILLSCFAWGCLAYLAQ